MYKVGDKVMHKGQRGTVESVFGTTVVIRLASGDTVWVTQK